ncbi:MAG TPA: large-conductance mechanosensitive channel protein MscL [Bacteroidia bacterium]|nr:large-conductance mechanosensitive channel protein MscL [Bacteroidia bacterium]
MSFVKEFKEFAMKGNVMDLAIGVIIGGAFGKIITSLVDNILMPIIGIFMQGVNFETLAVKVGDAEIKYGMFIGAILDFIIIALVLFLMIKAMNNMRKKEAAVPAAPPAPSNEEKLLMEIRDLLKK